MEENPQTTIHIEATSEDRVLRPVSQDDLRAAMFYAYQRARILKADSEFLAQHGRVARALGILIASNEELGKTLLIAEALEFQGGQTEKWGPWWNKIRSHTYKLIAAAEIDHLYLNPSPEEIRGRLALVDFIVSIREWAYYSDYISGYLISLDLLLDFVLSQGGQVAANFVDFLRFNFELTDARIYALRRLVSATAPASELSNQRTAKGSMPEVGDADRRRQREELQRLGIPSELATNPKAYDKVWRQWMKTSGYPLRT